MPLRCGQREEDAVRGTEAQASVYPGSDPHSEAGTQLAPSSSPVKAGGLVQRLIPPTASRALGHPRRGAAPEALLPQPSPDRHPPAQSRGPNGTAKVRERPAPARLPLSCRPAEGAGGAAPASGLLLSATPRPRQVGREELREGRPRGRGWAEPECGEGRRGASAAARAGGAGSPLRAGTGAGWWLCGRAPLPARYVPWETVLSVLFDVNRGSTEAETPRGKRANSGTAAELRCRPSLPCSSRSSLSLGVPQSTAQSVPAGPVTCCVCCCDCGRRYTASSYSAFEMEGSGYGLTDGWH